MKVNINHSNQEKGGLFSGLVKKIPKAAGDGPLAKVIHSHNCYVADMLSSYTPTIVVF